MTAAMDILSNPANISNYHSDPKIMAEDRRLLAILAEVRLAVAMQPVVDNG